MRLHPTGLIFKANLPYKSFSFFFKLCVIAIAWLIISTDTHTIYWLLFHFRRNHTESPSRQNYPNQQLQPQLQPDKSSESTKIKTSKTPRFSRLFGGGSKKSSEEKRCKSGRHSKHKQEQRLSKESRFKFPAHKSCEALLNDSPNGGKQSQNGSKTASPSKASKIQSEESKNAKGTLSSEHCFENGGNTKRKSRNIFKGLRKSSGWSLSLTETLLFNWKSYYKFWNGTSKFICTNSQ